jgi:hypothetical protein
VNHRLVKLRAMKVPNPAVQIPPPFARNPAPQRQLDAADLADLTQAPKPAPELVARTPAPTAADLRPQRPGSLLDIKV